MEINELVRVARGDAPADLLLRNARLVNVYSGEIYTADVALKGSRIAALGSGYQGKTEIDLKGSYLAPGLIDAHVHIESSMVGVRQFAQAVVPRGVTSVVADPHEIANVLGLDGIRYMFDQAKYGQLSMYRDGAVLRSRHQHGDRRRIPGSERYRCLAERSLGAGAGRNDELSGGGQRRPDRVGENPGISVAGSGRTRTRHDGQGPQRLRGSRYRLRS